MSKTIENSLLKDAVEFKVGRVFLYDSKTKVEYATATIKTSQLNATADQVLVRAGENNDVIYVIDPSKDLVFTLTDVIQDQNLLALKLGDGMKEADSTVYGFHMPELYQVTLDGSDKVIILSEEPKTGEEITFTNPLTGLQINPALVTQDSTNKKKFVITDSSITNGMNIQVGGFKFTGKLGDKYFNITSTSSANELFAVIEIPLVKPDMSPLCRKQYILPRCKLSASVDLTTASDPAEVDATHELTAMKPVSEKYVGRVYYQFPDSVVTAVPITDLASTSTTATEVDLTFSASTSADNIDIEYRLSTDSNWSMVNIGGSTGVYIATAVYQTDTTATVLGLTSASSYQFRLVVEGGINEGISNVTTVTVA